MLQRRRLQAFPLPLAREAAPLAARTSQGHTLEAVRQGAQATAPLTRSMAVGQSAVESHFWVPPSEVGLLTVT